jgi:hypothetical protein
MRCIFFKNWQIRGCIIVDRLYGFSREDGAILGCLVHDPMHPDWPVKLVRKDSQYESAAYLCLRDSEVFGRIVCPYQYIHIRVGGICCLNKRQSDFINKWESAVPVLFGPGRGDTRKTFSFRMEK